MEHPKVYIVIPNKDGREHLEYSIPSFLESTYPNLHIVVVDASTDESVEFLKSKYPVVHILQHKKDNTFASKVNAGIIFAMDHDADYIAVCNNDILLLPNWVEHGIDAFQKTQNAGIAGYTVMPREQKSNFLDIDHTNIKYDCREVESVNGACYLCAVNIFHDMGLFDETYHMYAEENDLFLRIRKAGYKIVLTNIRYWHYGEGSHWGGDPVLYVSWLNYRNAMKCAIQNDSLKNILRIFLSILNQAGNPFLSSEKIRDIGVRMRPYNIFFNVGIYLSSLIWNLLNLPKTIKQRISINKRAKDIKKNNLM